MDWKRSTAPLVAGACAAALCAGAFGGVHAQQAPPTAAQQGQPGQPAAPGQGGGRGGGRGNVAPALFTAVDVNKDASLTREELKTTFDKWYSDWDTARTGALTEEQILAGLAVVFPPPPAPAAGAGGGGQGGGRGQNQTPVPADVEKMMAALPDKAPAKPAQPRKVLVLAKSAGFVHSSIPLAAKTVEALGTKTGAWATTITYDSADINAANLKQYDAVILDSTTGAFLDDPNDAAATEARKKALLDFVRGGKGIAGIHAASDSYHRNGPPTPPADAAGRAGGGAGAGRGRGGFGTGATLAPLMVSQADRNNDQKISRAEFTGLADTWFEKLDTEKAGKVSQADFTTRFATAIIPPPAAPQGGGRGATPAQGPDNEQGTWPEWNTMIGGFFKWHWNDPQLINVKIDDPKSPLTAMFKGQPFEIHDETYTMSINSFSRENVHVLTSIDYSKMSDEDKAKEANPRADHDYGLSWIRREGQGRVFYEAHGHSERIYAITPMLEHILAGVQYAIGDLKADDSPSKKK